MIGKTVSHYRILEKLGGRGVGVVYKAEDTGRHRFVGLKFLSESLARHRQPQERLERSLPLIPVESRSAELKKK